MAIEQKKVLILIEGIGVGGTSTSLLNLLAAMRPYSEIEITVGLINIECRDRIPEDIKVLDCSCFSRRHKSKLDAVCHILRAGLFTWIRNKHLVHSEKKKMALSSKRVPLVQKYEWREAQIIKQKLDLSEKYDVVISWCEMYTNYLLANKIVAKNKIAWIHPHYEQAGFSRKRDEKMVTCIDRVVAVSQEGRDSLARVFPEHSSKFRCVYNKLLVDEVVRKSKEENVEFDLQVVNMITVSRIQNVSKAYDRTLRVMKRLKEEGFKFRWYIVGDGENQEVVHRLICEYGLEQEIKMLGEKANPFPYVAASDVFLLCSYYEGFPMVVDEALTLGVPVIVTNFAAAKEQVKNGKNGIIVPNTEDGVYDGLVRILSDNKLICDCKDYLKQQNHNVYAKCDDFVSLIMEICQA